MDALQPHLGNIRIPTDDKVYNDECIFSFDNPESSTGLYVCMNTFLGFGREFVEEYSEKSGNKMFLHIKHIRKELPPDKDAEPEKKIARLAIGVEGGFSADAGKKKYCLEEYHKLVLLPQFQEFAYPDPTLPEIVQLSASTILRMESALRQAEVEAAAQAWDGEVRQVSKHAQGLVQIQNGVQVPPSGWKCARCDKTDNLWMNLSDGSILCGRRQLDGSGGNNHAIEYYQNSGYPLAVKLGTITPDGKADVYSYAEDDMVINPLLVQHLATFGINVSKMEKTEKTMAELEIDYNQRAWEWSRLTESGGKLTPKYGPGYTGLRNLGNSCYLNSVIQVLIVVPSFVREFFDKRPEILRNVVPKQAPGDFNVQLSKVTHGILSGKYSYKPLKPLENAPDQEGLSVVMFRYSEKPLKPSENAPDQEGLSAVMFRSLVGKGHSEFSTKKQQDAMEFLEHLLKLTARNVRNSSGVEDAGHCFKFEVEDKFVCGESGKVRYVSRSDLYLPLPVPLEEATNKKEVEEFLARKEEAQKNNLPLKSEEQVHFKIPFSSCLSRLVAPEEINAFSSAVNKETVMKKITRLTTFPDFLFVQLVKFGLNDNWQPIKYDVSIDMPEQLDLTTLKGFGLQPGEVVMPDLTSSNEQATSSGINEGVVMQLVEMGFPLEACRKAVKLTGNTGSESAMNWIMEHMEDADFADPLDPAPDARSGAGGLLADPNFMPDAEGLAMLMSMGFTEPQSRLALKETANNIERAADWIFSHQPQLDALVAAQSGSEAPISSNLSQKPPTNGVPKYELVAFISHMGTSNFVGHYVCHIKKGGEWVLFNDEKVSKSENTPVDLGYIYLYRRIDGLPV